MFYGRNVVSEVNDVSSVEKNEVFAMNDASAMEEMWFLKLLVQMPWKK